VGWKNLQGTITAADQPPCCTRRRPGECQTPSIDIPIQLPSSLTIDQESEIVSNLSFLSSRRKDSKQVIAVAIEATEKSHEMVIRMAVNGEDAAYLREGLVQIGNILEKAARMVEPKYPNIILMLTDFR
jgi:hypothetical protein